MSYRSRPASGGRAASTNSSARDHVARAGECARFRAHPPRVPVHRYSRRGQDPSRASSPSRSTARPGFPPLRAASARRADIDAGRFVDLLEVDAASRTKVDDTRELLDNVQYAPTRGRYKVYLIDEVHMLSTHSFNALLKTLEEPPPHVKFLLATTDPQKLPVTVLSRCLQFHLRRLPLAQIRERLAHRSRPRKKSSSSRRRCARWRAAPRSSMRDALSLLDQVLAFGGGRAIESEVRTLLGTLDRRHVEAILNAPLRRGTAPRRPVVQQLDERAPITTRRSANSRRHPAHGDPAHAARPARRDEEEDAALAALRPSFSPEDLQLYYQIAIMARRDLDYAPDARGGFEMALLRMLAFHPDAPVSPPHVDAAPGSRPSRRAAQAARPASGPFGVGGTSGLRRRRTARGAAPSARPRRPPWIRRPRTGRRRGGQLRPTRQLAAHCVFVGRGRRRPAAAGPGR